MSARRTAGAPRELVVPVARWVALVRALPNGSPHGVRRPWVVGIVAALALALVAAGLVAIRRPAERNLDAAAQPGIVVAANFAEKVTTTDADARARAIGRWVVPHRVTEFVSAFDKNFADSERPGRRVSATPRRFRVVETSPTVAEVLIWSEVRWTDGGAEAGAPSWEISAFGVILQAGRWWVFSYDGTKYGVPPGDERLEGFAELARAPGPRPP